MAFTFDPENFDPKRTYTGLESYLPKLASPRHRANLQTVIDHSRGEVERNLNALMGTLRPDASYHFWSWNPTDDAPKSYAEIREYYRYYVTSGQAFIEARQLRVAVADALVCTEAIITNIHTGEIAAWYGFQIEEKDAVYASQMRNMVLWNMDENAKAFGEDAYTWRRPEDCVKLAPRQVPRAYFDYMSEIGKEVPGGAARK